VKIRRKLFHGCLDLCDDLVCICRCLAPSPNHC
jgi:hypothetical protein